MLKRILTLFAILTGLAAFAAPAQARYALLEDVGVHASGESAVKCADKRIGDQAQPGSHVLERRGQTVTCSPPVITIVIPTVMLQADRARE